MTSGDSFLRVMEGPILQEMKDQGFAGQEERRG